MCIKTGSNCPLKNKKLVVLGRTGFVQIFFFSFKSGSMPSKTKQAVHLLREEYCHSLSAPWRNWPDLAALLLKDREQNACNQLLRNLADFSWLWSQACASMVSERNCLSTDFSLVFWPIIFHRWYGKSCLFSRVFWASERYWGTEGVSQNLSSLCPPSPQPTIRSRATSLALIPDMLSTAGLGWESTVRVFQGCQCIVNRPLGYEKLNVVYTRGQNVCMNPALASSEIVPIATNMWEETSWTGSGAVTWCFLGQGL